MFTLKTHLSENLLKIFLITICCFGFNGAAWGQDGDHGFQDANGVQFVSLSDANKTAYVYGNEGATGAVTIPATIVLDDGETYSVTTIGSGAFSGNKNITSVAISEGILSINSNAFYGCSSLTSISLPSTVTTIGQAVFQGCSSWTGSITLPAALTSIGDNAFNGVGLNGTIKFNGTGALTIGNYAFYSTGITGPLVLPAGTTSIGDYAFTNCIGLTQLFGVTSLTHIGAYAFSGDMNLANNFVKALNFSAIQSIGNYAFYNCSRLSCKVTLGGSITNIGNSAFEGCSKISNLSLTTTSLTSIGTKAFKDCNSMNAVITLSNQSLTSIPDYAFYGCSKLTNVSGSSPISSIGQHAFDGTSLTQISFPTTITSIGDYAFKGCKLSGALNLPSTISTIGEGVFQDCSGLTGTLNISGITSLGNYAFSGCSGLTGSLTFNSGLTTIPKQAFYGCSGITGITLTGSGVTRLGEQCFANCTGLTTVTIPTTVTTIEDSPFQNCTALTSLYMLSSTAPTATASGNLLTNGGLCTVYIPEDDTDAQTIYNSYHDNATWKTGVKGFKHYHKGVVNRTGPYNATADRKGFSSVYLNFSFEVPSGLTAYYAYADDGSNVKLKAVSANSNNKFIVPAKEAVILVDENLTLENAATYDLTETYETVTDFSDNILKGSLATTTVPSGAMTLGIGSNNGLVGFYRYTGSSLGAHKAYYIPTATSGSSVRYFSFDEPTTVGIDNVDAGSKTSTNTYYDLSGKRTNNPVKGNIYLVNGKKVIF